MLKIAKILAAQASAQPFKNNCGTSAIASKIVAPQVPTSGYVHNCNTRQKHQNEFFEAYVGSEIGRKALHHIGTNVTWLIKKENTQIKDNINLLFELRALKI